MNNKVKLIVSIYILFIISFIVLKYSRKVLKFKNSNDVRKGARIYERLSSIPFLGPSIERLKMRLYLKSSQEEYVLRHQAVSVFFISSGATIIFLGVLIKFYVSDMYTFLCAIMASVFIDNFVTDHYIGTDIKLLKSFRELINNIKYNYEKYSKRVDKALYEASKVSSTDISFHGMSIYKAVKNGKSELNEYLQRCPNHFLKFLANLSFTVKEYGDKNADGESYYIKNLNFLMEQAEAEYKKKDKLKTKLQLGVIASIIPAAFPKLLEAWIRKYFPSISFIFDSSAGYFARIAVLAICFSCYYLIKKYQDDQQINVDRLIVKDKFWEEELLKIKVIKTIVRKMTPVVDTKKYFKTDQLIQNSGINIQIEWLILRKLLTGCITTILFIGFFIGSHNANINRIINDSQYGISNVNYMIMTGSVSEDNLDKQKIIESDKKVIYEIRDFKGDRDEEVLKQVKVNESNSDQIKLDISRITNKLTAISKEHIHWYEFIITLVAALLLSNIPVWYLKFKKSIRQKDMQNETFQFETIMIMLMNHNKVSVLMILKQMEQFANVFKDPIRKSINRYSKGHVEALMQLKKDVRFWPFQMIVEKLIIAADGIKIKKAFNSLELEREFRKDDIKDTYDKQVKDSIAICDEISKIPMIVVVVVYLIIPITLYALIGMKDVYGQLNNVGK